jgi:hypothetical protein
MGQGRGRFSFNDCLGFIPELICFSQAHSHWFPACFARTANCGRIESASTHALSTEGDPQFFHSVSQRVGVNVQRPPRSTRSADFSSGSFQGGGDMPAHGLVQGKEGAAGTAEKGGSVTIGAWMTG